MASPKAQNVFSRFLLCKTFFSTDQADLLSFAKAQPFTVNIRFGYKVARVTAMDTGDLKRRYIINIGAAIICKTILKLFRIICRTKKIEITPVANDIKPCCLHLALCKHIN